MGLRVRMSLVPATTDGPTIDEAVEGDGQSNVVALAVPLTVFAQPGETPIPGIPTEVPTEPRRPACAVAADPERHGRRYPRRVSRRRGEPAPSLPAPSEPAPSEPAPSLPAPSEPTPSEPAPSEPAPSEPSHPVPSEPAPSEPAPSEPAPGEPAPPAPSEPAPSEPAPAEPSVPCWRSRSR